MSTSSAAVFKNPLLLHRIFLHLPSLQLLTKQRVCTRWRDLLSRSHSLLRPLYLSPDGPPQRLHAPLLHPVNPNPLMQFSCNGSHHQPNRHHGEAPNPHSMAALNVSAKSRDTYGEFGSQTHAFRFELFIGPLLKDAPYEYYEVHHRDEARFHYTLWSTARKYGHPNASWRKMLFSQPPLVALEFKSRVLSPRVIYNPKGLTLGEIHDWAAELVDMYLQSGQESADSVPLGWFEFSMPSFPEAEATSLTRTLQRCYECGPGGGGCRCIQALKQVRDEDLVPHVGRDREAES